MPYRTKQEKIWSQPFEIKNLLKIKIEKENLILMGEEDKIYSLKTLNKKAFIKRLYSLLFDRLPKNHEIEYWENKIVSKNDLMQSVIYLFNLEEFLEKRDTLSLLSFIKLSYKTLLNREVDIKGLNYWQHFNKQEIIKKLLQSKEFKEKIQYLL